MLYIPHLLTKPLPFKTGYITSRDQTPTNTVVISKRYCVDYLKIELVLGISQGNHTYTTTVLSSFGLSMNDEEHLPSLYSIQKLCASVYANYIILLELPRVLPSLFLNL